jgi:hypothetical protein
MSLLAGFVALGKFPTSVSPSVHGVSDYSRMGIRVQDFGRSTSSGFIASSKLQHLCPPSGQNSAGGDGGLTFSLGLSWKVTCGTCMYHASREADICVCMHVLPGQGQR